MACRARRTGSNLIFFSAEWNRPPARRGEQLVLNKVGVAACSDSKSLFDSHLHRSVELTVHPPDEVRQKKNVACQEGVSHLIRSVELTATPAARPRPTTEAYLIAGSDNVPTIRMAGYEVRDRHAHRQTPPNTARHTPNTHRTKHQHQAPPRATTKRHTARRAQPRALHVHTREERSSGDRTTSHVEGRPELHLIRRAWSLTQNHLSYGTVMTTHDATRAQPRASLGGRAPEGRRLGRALLDRHPAQGVRLHDLRQRTDVRHLTVCHHSDTNVSSQRSSPL